MFLHKPGLRTAQSLLQCFDSGRRVFTPLRVTAEFLSAGRSGGLEKKQNVQKGVLRDNTGSTLVELLLAMVLLLSVALPAGMFLGYMANYPANQQKMIAFGIAQSAMEEMLHDNVFVAGTDTEEVSPGWMLTRTQSTQDGWVFLRVTVSRKDAVLVTLNTARLYAEDE